jgi:hypothetical protein
MPLTVTFTIRPLDSLTAKVSPTVVNNVTAGYQYWNNLTGSNIRANNVSFPSGADFGTNVNVPQQSLQKKGQFKDDISFTKGRHNLRAGIDFLQFTGGETGRLMDPSLTTAASAC